MVYGSRVSPAGIFSLLWSACLTWLESKGEIDCVHLLKTYYLECVNGLWDASWRHSPTRILPGSASGSQAQESWHVHRLIPGVSGLKQPLADFVTDLRSFVGSRADQLAKQTSLYQVPGSQWDPELWTGVAVVHTYWQQLFVYDPMVLGAGNTFGNSSCFGCYKLKACICNWGKNFQVVQLFL